MAFVTCGRRFMYEVTQNLRCISRIFDADVCIISRFSSTTTRQHEPSKATELQNAETETPSSGPSIPTNERTTVVPPQYRFIYPEFLPDPAMDKRNAVREKLERTDMLMRRSQIDIPEFYVGSILAVTTSDPHSGGKLNRFVGICITRTGCGLRASFILRNVVDHQGMEVLYEMYNPTIQKIEVLRLEKRLDDKLFYLRDALPEYSTFPFDMETEFHPEGAPIPVNDIKVKLKPHPWLERWERQNLKGVQDLELSERFYKRAEELATPWEKYDLMKQYRATIPDEEQSEIFSEIHSELHQLEMTKKKMKRKRVFVKPKKLA